jgi:hypothetical protein
MENLRTNKVINYWWYGFISAIFFVMIFNIISQHVKTTYYQKLFCPN